MVTKTNHNGGSNNQKDDMFQSIRPSRWMVEDEITDSPRHRSSFTESPGRSPSIRVKRILSMEEIMSLEREIQEEEAEAAKTEQAENIPEEGAMQPEMAKRGTDPEEKNNEAYENPQDINSSSNRDNSTLHGDHATKDMLDASRGNGMDDVGAAPGRWSFAVSPFRSPSIRVKKILSVEEMMLLEREIQQEEDSAAAVGLAASESRECDILVGRKEEVAEKTMVLIKEKIEASQLEEKKNERVDGQDSSTKQIEAESQPVAEKPVEANVRQEETVPSHDEATDTRVSTLRPSRWMADEESMDDEGTECSRRSFAFSPGRSPSIRVKAILSVEEIMSLERDIDSEGERTNEPLTSAEEKEEVHASSPLITNKVQKTESNSLAAMENELAHEEGLVSSTEKKEGEAQASKQKKSWTSPLVDTEKENVVVGEGERQMDRAGNPTDQETSSSTILEARERKEPQAIAGQQKPVAEKYGEIELIVGVADGDPVEEEEPKKSSEKELNMRMKGMEPGMAGEETQRRQPHSPKQRRHVLATSQSVLSTPERTDSNKNTTSPNKKHGERKSSARVRARAAGKMHDDDITSSSPSLPNDATKLPQTQEAMAQKQQDIVDMQKLVGDITSVAVTTEPKPPPPSIESPLQRQLKPKDSNAAKVASNLTASPQPSTTKAAPRTARRRAPPKVKVECDEEEGQKEYKDNWWEESADDSSDDEAVFSHDAEFKTADMPDLMLLLEKTKEDKQDRVNLPTLHVPSATEAPTSTTSTASPGAVNVDSHILDKAASKEEPLKSPKSPAAKNEKKPRRKRPSQAIPKSPQRHRSGPPKLLSPTSKSTTDGTSSDKDPTSTTPRRMKKKALSSTKAKRKSVKRSNSPRRDNNSEDKGEIPSSQKRDERDEDNGKFPHSHKTDKHDIDNAANPSAGTTANERTTDEATGGEKEYPKVEQLDTIPTTKSDYVKSNAGKKEKTGKDNVSTKEPSLNEEIRTNQVDVASPNADEPKKPTGKAKRKSIKPNGHKKEKKLSVKERGSNAKESPKDPQPLDKKVGPVSKKLESPSGKRISLKESRGENNRSVTKKKKPKKDTKPNEPEQPTGVGSSNDDPVDAAAGKRDSLSPVTNGEGHSMRDIHQSPRSPLRQRPLPMEPSSPPSPPSTPPPQSTDLDSDDEKLDYMARGSSPSKDEGGVGSLARLSFILPQRRHSFQQVVSDMECVPTPKSAVKGLLGMLPQRENPIQIDLASPTNEKPKLSDKVGEDLARLSGMLPRRSQSFRQSVADMECVPTPKSAMKGLLGMLPQRENPIYIDLGSPASGERKQSGRTGPDLARLSLMLPQRQSSRKLIDDMECVPTPKSAVKGLLGMLPQRDNPIHIDLTSPDNEKSRLKDKLDEATSPTSSTLPIPFPMPDL